MNDAIGTLMAVVAAAAFGDDAVAQTAAISMS
jgi:hypothetical protein